MNIHEHIHQQYQCPVYIPVIDIHAFYIEFQYNISRLQFTILSSGRITHYLLSIIHHISHYKKMLNHTVNHTVEHTVNH
jgi:hypothetical protein